MRRLLAIPSIAFIALAATLCGCPPSHQFTAAEIPKLTTLGDLMWAQAQATDPQFKKIGRAGGFEDGDYAAFTAAAERVFAVSARVKKEFSKGPEYDEWVDHLDMHAHELAEAAAARNAQAADRALSEMKAACKGCHSKFR